MNSKRSNLSNKENRSYRESFTNRDEPRYNEDIPTRRSKSKEDPPTSQLDASATPPVIKRSKRHKSQRRQLIANVCNTRFDIVKKVLQLSGFKIAEEEDYKNADLVWSDSYISTERFTELQSHQKTNHFPGMNEISRKDSLAKNYAKMAKLLPDLFDFMAPTWVLPQENAQFQAHLKKLQRPTVFIQKPANGSMGAGIKLFSSSHSNSQQQQLQSTSIPNGSQQQQQSTSANNDEPATATAAPASTIPSAASNPPAIAASSEVSIVQTYIDRPFLLDGFKCDLRIYVLVTGSDPLRVFLFNEGLVRLCTEKYQPLGDAASSTSITANLSRHYMHLTNYSVNKHNTAAVTGTGSGGATSSTNQKRRRETGGGGGGQEGSGFKRSLTQFRQFLRDRNYPTGAVWRSITDLIVYSLLMIQPQLRHHYRTARPGRHNPRDAAAAFEILGYDILLDEKLRPWLIEVNRSPSLATDQPIDERIKQRLLEDVIRLANMRVGDRARTRAAEKQRAVRRLWGSAASNNAMNGGHGGGASSQGGGATLECLNWERERDRLKKLEKRRDMLRDRLLRMRRDHRRDKWEKENCGHFQRIFPNEDDRLKQEEYEKVLAEAERLFEKERGGGRHNATISSTMTTTTTTSSDQQQEESLDAAAFNEDDLIDAIVQLNEQIEKILSRFNLNPKVLEKIVEENRKLLMEDAEQQQNEEEEGYESDSELDESDEAAAPATQPEIKEHEEFFGLHWKKATRQSVLDVFKEKSRGGAGVRESDAPPPPSAKLVSKPGPTAGNSDDHPAADAGKLGALDSDSRRRCSELAEQHKTLLDRNVLDAISRMNIRYPNKSEPETAAIIDALRTQISSAAGRADLSRFWLTRLNAVKRQRVLDIVRENVRTMLEQQNLACLDTAATTATTMNGTATKWRRRATTITLAASLHHSESGSTGTLDVGSSRLHRLFLRVYSRLLWNHGHGLIQCFSRPGWWETMLTKSVDRVSDTELAICRRLARLCEDSLLVVYHYTKQMYKRDGDEKNPDNACVGHDERASSNAIQATL